MVLELKYDSQKLNCFCSERIKEAFIFLLTDLYDDAIKNYIKEFLNSSFPGFISMDDSSSVNDVLTTITDCFGLISAANPDFLIHTLAALRNGSCIDDEKNATICDEGFTHDNYSERCYKMLKNGVTFYDIESNSELCQKYGAEYLIFDSDLQVQGLLKILNQGKKMFFQRRLT